MKFLNWLARKSAFWAGPVDEYSERVLQREPTLSGQVVTEHSSLGLSAVWACTRLLAQTTASLPVEVLHGVEGIREPDPEHPLSNILLYRPNFEQTPVNFFEYVTVSIELRGNSFARIVRDNKGRVVALHLINPANMSVVRKPDGSLEYSWSFEGKQYRLGEQDVLHIRGFGGDPMGGMSTLKHARQTFGLAQAADVSAASIFRNGMTPSGALSFESWLNDSQREIAETKMVDKYIGAINAGRPLVLEGGVEWKSLTIDPKDAQMIETRKFSVEEICRFFGVPPHMIGHTEKSTSWGSGLDQQTLGFQKFTLAPRLRRIEQAMEQQLLSAKDKAAGYTLRFNMDGLLRADAKGRGDYYEKMIRMGAMTINEVRQRENLKPVPGGEIPRLQMQNVPIDQADTRPNEAETDVD